MSDLTTVVRKEWQEFFHYNPKQAGQLGGIVFSFLMMMGFLVFISFQTRIPYAAGFAAIGFGVLSIGSWIMFTIVDSFAGERERHTLETLLASRLPNGAILFGKLTANCVGAAGLGLITSLVGVLVVAGLFGQWGILAILVPACILGTVAGILLFLPSASIGVILSMRAPTVKIAQQRMAYIFMVQMFLLTALPGGAAYLFFAERAFFEQIQLSLLISFLVLALIGINVMLLVLAYRLFHRERLMLA